MQMEAVYYSAHSTTYSLFFNTICSLLVLVAVNVPLRKIDVNLALNREELIAIFVMLNQSSALVGHSMLISNKALLRLFPEYLSCCFALRNKFLFSYLLKMVKAPYQIITVQYHTTQESLSYGSTKWFKEYRVVI